MSTPKKKNQFDCSKCTGYCCSYDHIEVTESDIARLAKHFKLSVKTAREKFIKIVEGKTPVLRHRKDHIFKSMCTFFDQEKRCCTIYSARPSVCRQYPNGTTCGYYMFLRFERRHAEDETMIP